MIPNYPPDWRKTPAGRASYNAAKDEARTLATASGKDVGLEPNDVMRTWHVWILPPAAIRTGHELWCEVIPVNHGGREARRDV